MTIQEAIKNFCDTKLLQIRSNDWKSLGYELREEILKKSDKAILYCIVKYFNIRTKGLEYTQEERKELITQKYNGHGSTYDVIKQSVIKQYIKDNY